MSAVAWEMIASSKTCSLPRRNFAHRRGQLGGGAQSSLAWNRMNASLKMAFRKRNAMPMQEAVAVFVELNGRWPSCPAFTAPMWVASRHCA